jgi:hypothetical protein
MKQNIFIALCLLVLVAGSVYNRNESSYADFIAAGIVTADTAADESSGAALPGMSAADEAPNDEDGAYVSVAGDDADTGHVSIGAVRRDMDITEGKTLEDIALDKRLDQERKRNEKTYRESGIVGTSFRSEVKEPLYEIDEIAAQLNAVYAYIEDHHDEFTPFIEDVTFLQICHDPRVRRLIYSDLYGEAREGFLADFESENMVAWDVKKSSGDYTILISGRDAVGEDWRIVWEGDVYELKQEVTVGD